METLPINLTEMVTAVMAMMLALIPVVGLVVRFAAKPVVEALLATRGEGARPADLDALPAGGADQEEPAADADIPAREAPGTISIGTFAELDSEPAGPAPADEPSGPSMPRPAQSLPGTCGCWPRTPRRA